MDKLVLIDGNSLLNRAFYATPLFSTKNGNPTNAIFGFVKLVFKILGDLKPEYMVVAFDLKAPTFRHKMFDGYKATRKAMPAELSVQVEPLKSLLAAMKIATCEKEGLEADDIIGTLSKKFEVHSYIYTGDRDSYQLVDDKTDVHYTRKGVSDLLRLTKDNFFDEVGVNPVQIIDLKALMGDKSDNIPGVTGVGEKTAVNLINTYGSLDGVYEHLEEIKGTLRDKLISNKEQAYMSYKLATIDRNCEIELNLEDCPAPKNYSMEVKRLFTEFEFKSLLSMDIFEGEEKASAGNEVIYPELIKCENTADIDVSDGELFVDFKDDGVEIYNGRKQYSLKFSNDLLGNISFDGFLQYIKSLFENKDNHIIVYDFKNVLHKLSREYGIKVRCNADDVSVMKYLCDFYDNSASLKDCCAYYGYNYEYSAFALSLLYNKYLPVLKSEELENLYESIEKPLIKVLFDMESQGVAVNVDELSDFSVQYNKKISELTEKIYALCDCKFNINSPSQLGEVLFEKLGLKSGKKSKTGKYSTSADILEKLADEHEVVKLILVYRQYQKLLSTYIEGIRPLIDKTSRVHTTYNQTVTVTGRLSSTNPNLQNIPIREEEGRELRKIFVPSDGCVFIDADYSQIELRLLAHFSGCKELIEAYVENRDIHTVTASQVFGVSPDNVTPEMRREAKAVNFGIIYGISDFGLAKNLNISVKTAREYIENYFKTYSAVKEYMDNNVKFAKEHGFVATLSGRKRYIREINSSNYNLRQFGERAAMNMPLQGSSADIIKIAMLNVFNALKNGGLKTKLILQVHDEIVLDCPIEEREQASEILKREMENAVKLKVPLVVDVHTGKNLYEAK